MTRLQSLTVLAVLVAGLWGSDSRADEKTFSVAPGGWVATGIEIKPGQFFEISAKGTLKHPGGRESGPDGYYWLGFQAWTFKYRIGEHPPNEGLHDSGSGATGFGGEKGGQLYLGVSNTYDPVPAESAVSGSFEVTVSFGENSNTDLGGNTGGGLLPGVQPPIPGSASGKTPKRGSSPLWPGLIPPLVVSLVNARDLINRRRPKKLKTDGPLTTSIRESLPGVPPEIPPYVRGNPRDKTPAPCRQFHDDYVAMQQEITGMEGPIRLATETYWESQRRLNQNLAKFSIQLAWDTSDLASAGAGGIKGAMGIATLITQIPDALRKGLQLARTAASKAARKIGQLTEQVAELARRAKSLLQNADQLGTRSKALANSIDELTEAASAAEKRLAEQLRFLSFMDEADGLVPERNRLAGELVEGEASLVKKREKIDANQKRLDAIPDEQFTAARESEQATRNLRELESGIAALEGDAAKKASSARESLGKCEREIGDLETRKAKLDELKTRRDKFLADEADVEAKGKELLSAEQELHRARDLKLEREKIERLQRHLETLQENHKELLRNYNEAEYNYSGAMHRQREYLDDLANSSAGELDPNSLSPQQRAAVQTLEADVSEAHKKFISARDTLNKTYAELHATEYDVQLFDQRVLAQAPEELVQAINAAEAKVKELSAGHAASRAEWENSSKALQAYSHPGMNLGELPTINSELATQRQRRPGLQNAVTEAVEAEQTARTRAVEKRAELPALRTRDAECDARISALRKEIKTLEADNNRQGVLAEKQDAKLRKLKADLEAAEKKLADVQSRIPAGATRETLLREITAHRDAIAANNKRIADLRKELDEGRQPIADARKLANTVEAERAAKIKDLEQAEEEKQKAEEELKRLEAELEKHAEDPDLIDRIRNASKDASNRVKPGFVKDFEGWVKGKAATLGDLWEKAFGGQSPEEVAQILKHGHETVQRRLNELNELLADRDELMGALRGLRGELEMCKIQFANTENSP